MAKQIFNQAFDQQVKDELTYRRSFDNVQTSFFPHVRVTSLVRGTLPVLAGQRLRGLTLGPVDKIEFSNLEDKVSTAGIYTNVGITYENNRPELVKIPTTKLNLPAPGVEDVRIDVQNGGYIFKADLTIRCYGTEQYNFLYQTFMRPGTPIVIEYGHTRVQGNDDTVDLSDLNFFRTLNDDRIELFDRMAKGFAGPIRTRTSETVVGLITNFDVKLNENNEYEISLELVNSLEWFYNIQNKNTFISYDPGNELNSKSIDLSFGLGDGAEYQPETDTIFRIVLRELEKKNETVERPTGRQQVRERPPVFFFRNINISATVNAGGPGARRRLVTVDGIESDAQVMRQARNSADDVYVSLDYFLKSLINDILNTSYDDIGEVLENLKNQRNIFGRLTGRDEYGELNSNLNNLDQEGPRIMLSPESFCTFWRSLRSTNKGVVFNNKFLYDNTDTTKNYSEFFYRLRYQDYIDKYDIAPKTSIRNEVSTFFTIDPTLENRAELYGSGVEDGEPVGGNVDGIRVFNFKGIYLKYTTIRNAFRGSDTFTEAIVKILNAVNDASNGVLNLKMNLLELNGDETYELVVYDESSLYGLREAPEIYTFFEEDISEAISYELDFNLPSSVASIIVANEFKTSYAAGGDLKNKLFIDYGYDSRISKLVGQSPPTQDHSDDGATPRPQEYGIKDATELRNTRNATQDRIFGGVDSSVGTNSLLGYIELTPPSMLGDLVNSGLNNTLPSAAKVKINLQGISGMRWGNLFGVKNILPEPYNDNSLFMVVGYSHNITSQGWVTTILGQLIASNPETSNPAFPEDPDFEDERRNTNLIGVGREEEVNLILSANSPWDVANIQGLDYRWYPIIVDARRELRERYPQYDFGITSGVRTRSQQEALRQEGRDANEVRGGNTSASAPPVAEYSRHFDGRAIDLNVVELDQNGQRQKYITYSDYINNEPGAVFAYRTLADIMRRSGEKYGVRVIWGGNFITVPPDPIHFHF